MHSTNIFKSIAHCLMAILIHPFIETPFINAFIPHTPLVQHASQSYLKATPRRTEEDPQEEMDWRAFRAHLVQSESPSSSSSFLSSATNQWTYDTGTYIEPGSIIISFPSSNPRNQDIDTLSHVCYRKAIVLVLEVGDYVQGILLNRPTCVFVDGVKFVPSNSKNINGEDKGSGGEGEERSGEESQWKVWFGGESFGLYSDDPQVMCLHSIQTEMALELSEVVLPGILMTSYEAAKTLVQKNQATPSDFWLFCGISGWETQTFYNEMNNENLWRIISSDGGTILEELNMQRCEDEDKICDVDSDSRNGGIHTWEMLMEKIGGSVDEDGDSFGDLMLREWATGVLSFSYEEEGRSESNMITEWADGRMDVMDGGFDVTQYDPAYSMTSLTDTVGKMIRASSACRSPFLLSDQGYHKSIILILRDDNECTEGVILNHVTDSSYPLDVGNGNTVELTIRYGGPVQECEDEMLPLIFLHTNTHLAMSGIGSNVSDGIFKCTEEETIHAITMGLASPDEFMAIQGLSVWKKHQVSDSIVGGVSGDIEEGFFEPVPQNRMVDVWNTLMAQSKLSLATIDENMNLLQKAWGQAGSADSGNECEIQVFGSDVGVAELADQALRRWIGAYLLDDEIQ